MSEILKKYKPHSLSKRYKKSRVHGKKFNKRIKENNEVLNKAKSNE
jgi:hypothetical protein